VRFKLLISALTISLMLSLSGIAHSDDSPPDIEPPAPPAGIHVVTLNTGPLTQDDNDLQPPTRVGNFRVLPGSGVDGPGWESYDVSWGRAIDDESGFDEIRYQFTLDHIPQATFGPLIHTTVLVPCGNTTAIGIEAEDETGKQGSEQFQTVTAC
jgi:hypothetical protein